MSNGQVYCTKCGDFVYDRECEYARRDAENAHRYQISNSQWRTLGDSLWKKERNLLCSADLAVSGVLLQEMPGPIFELHLESGQAGGGAVAIRQRTLFTGQFFKYDWFVLFFWRFAFAEVLSLSGHFIQRFISPCSFSAKNVARFNQLCFKNFINCYRSAWSCESRKQLVNLFLTLNDWYYPMSLSWHVTCRFSAKFASKSWSISVSCPVFYKHWCILRCWEIISWPINTGAIRRAA